MTMQRCTLTVTTRNGLPVHSETFDNASSLALNIERSKRHVGIVGRFPDHYYFATFQLFNPATRRWES